MGATRAIVLRAGLAAAARGADRAVPAAPAARDTLGSKLDTVLVQQRELLAGQQRILGAVEREDPFRTRRFAVAVNVPLAIATAGRDVQILSGSFCWFPPDTPVEIVVPVWWRRDRDGTVELPGGASDDFDFNGLAVDLQGRWYLEQTSELGTSDTMPRGYDPAVGFVSRHPLQLESPGVRPLDETARDNPLLSTADVVRYSSEQTSFVLTRPTPFWDVQFRVEQASGGPLDARAPRSHSAVFDLARPSSTLALDSSRLCRRFGEAGLIEDCYHYFAAKGYSNWLSNTQHESVFIPTALPDELLEHSQRNTGLRCSTYGCLPFGMNIQPRDMRRKMPLAKNSLYVIPNQIDELAECKLHTLHIRNGCCHGRLCTSDSKVDAMTHVAERDKWDNRTRRQREERLHSQHRLGDGYSDTTPQVDYNPPVEAGNPNSESWTRIK